MYTLLEVQVTSVLEAHRKRGFTITCQARY